LEDTVNYRRGRAALCSLVGVLGLGLVACQTDSSPSSPEPTPAPNEPAPPRPSCKPPTGGPTVHKGDVAGDEVWTAAGSPHVVEYTVNVRNGAKLTIEPCAEVRVAKKQTINVAYPITPNTGTLIAEGTAETPIRIVGEGGERWASLSIHAPGTARLAHVTFENGGGGDFQGGATVAVYGDGEDGADELVFADHVTIAKSLGTGAWLTRGAAFAKGSSDLTIKESGDAEHPYPIEIEEHAFDTFPTGAYKGNAVDEIFVSPQGGKMGGSGLLADATLHERGVPYHIGGSKGHSLLIGGRDDQKLVTLTIEPGVVMKFVEGAALKVQHFVTTKPSTAALRALGTAEKPIVMTSAASSPRPGDWRGVWFGGIPASANQMDHVRLEYAGGDCGCILNTCSNIEQHEAAVIFTAQPPSPFITNTVFVQSAGHGITQGFDGAFVDFRSTNTFEGVTGCAQTRPRETTTQCPNPRPLCDGL
jgi:hypothetical protein